jgi:hypothetical protein
MTIPDGAGSWYLSEDYAFCARARQCGFQIMADTTIRLWHVGSYRYGWEDAGGDKQRFGTYSCSFNTKDVKAAHQSSASGYEPRP